MWPSRQAEPGTSRYYQGRLCTNDSHSRGHKSGNWMETSHDWPGTYRMIYGFCNRAGATILLLSILLARRDDKMVRAVVKTATSSEAQA